MKTESTIAGESRIPILLIILAGLLLLSGCNGGICGTGSGNGCIDENNVEHNAGTDNDMDIDGDADSEGDGTDDNSADSGGNMGTSAHEQFDSNYAFLRIINATTLDDNVVVINDETNEPLIDLPGLYRDPGYTQYLFLTPQQVGSVSIYTAEDYRAGNATPVASTPMSLASGTASSLLVLDSRPGSDADAQAPSTRPDIGVTLLANHISASADQGKYRVVLSDNRLAGLVDVYLITPTAVLEDESPISQNLATEPGTSTGYHLIDTGFYQLALVSSDTGQLLASSDILIEMAANQVLTLIVHDDTGSDTLDVLNLMVIHDSVLE